MPILYTSVHYPQTILIILGKFEKLPLPTFDSLLQFNRYGEKRSVLFVVCPYFLESKMTLSYDDRKMFETAENDLNAMIIATKLQKLLLSQYEGPFITPTLDTIIDLSQRTVETMRSRIDRQNNV